MDDIGKSWRWPAFLPARARDVRLIPGHRRSTLDSSGTMAERAEKSPRGRSLWAQALRCGSLEIERGDPRPHATDLRSQARERGTVGIGLRANEGVSPHQMWKQFQPDQLPKPAAQSVSLRRMVLVSGNNESYSRLRKTRVTGANVEMGGLHSPPRVPHDFNVRFLRQPLAS